VEAGASALVIEAGKTLVVDRDAMVKKRISTASPL